MKKLLFFFLLILSLQMVYAQCVGEGERVVVEKNITHVPNFTTNCCAGLEAVSYKVSYTEGGITTTSDYVYDCEDRTFENFLFQLQGYFIFFIVILVLSIIIVGNILSIMIIEMDKSSYMKLIFSLDLTPKIIESLFIKTKYYNSKSFRVFITIHKIQMLLVILVLALVVIMNNVRF